MRNVAGSGCLRGTIAALALLALAACGSADKAANALGAGPGVGETTVSMPFELNVAGGAAPTAVQADVRYDSASYRVTGIAKGDAATAAGKDLSWSRISDDQVRIMVFGDDQGVDKALDSGVLATFDFVDRNGSGRAPALAVSNAAAVDAKATTLNAAASGKGLEVRR